MQFKQAPLQRQIVGIFALAGTLAASGCETNSPATTVPQSDSPARQVRLTAAAKTEAARTVSASGTLAADDQVILGTKVVGRLAEIGVDLGSRVKKGQALARIDPSDYRLRVEQAEAALQQARVRLGLSPTGGRASGHGWPEVSPHCLPGHSRRPERPSRMGLPLPTPRIAMASRLLNFALLAGVAYFCAMAVAHFFGIKWPLLFVYYDVPFHAYQDKIISFAVVAYACLWWSAAQERWLEVSSISNFETFQTNRLKCRFRDEKGKTQLAHSLNGSALALPRIVAALLENNQTPEGIKLPGVLHSYCGFSTIG